MIARWLRRRTPESAAGIAGTIVPAMPAADEAEVRRQRAHVRQERFARMLAGRAMSDEARKALEHHLLDIVIAALKEGAMTEDASRQFATLVLARIDTAHTAEDFVALLRSLADRWPVFRGLLAVERATMVGRPLAMEEGHAADTGRLATFLMLAEEGPLGPIEIEEAVDLANRAAAILEQMADPAFDAVVAAYRAAQRLHQTMLDRWLNNAAVIEQDLRWYAAQGPEVWADAGPTYIIRVHGALDDAWDLIAPYPGLVDGLDRRALRVLACLTAGYDLDPGTDWLVPFRARFRTAVAEAEREAGIQLLRRAEAEANGGADSTDAPA